MVGMLDSMIPASDGGGLLDFLRQNLTGPTSEPTPESKKQEEAAALAASLGSLGVDPNGGIQPGMLPPPPAAAPAPMNIPPGIAPPISTNNMPPPGAPPAAPNVPALGGLGLFPPAPATPSNWLQDAQRMPTGGTPPAAPTFGAGATPFQFAGPGSLNLSPNAPGNPPVVAADDEGDDEAPAAPAQASPIPVGNVQMPRVGPAAAYTPQPAAPAPAATAPAAPDATPDIGDRLMAGYQNLHHGGGLIGSLVAAVTGKRNDAQGVALQQQTQAANLTARALLAKGVDPQTVAAAVSPGNGEMLKQLIDQTFSRGQYTQETDKDGNVWNVNKVTGQKTVALQTKDDRFTSDKVKNADGSETERSFNTKTGEYGAPVAPNNARGSIDPGTTGQARMDALKAADPNYARKIQAMVNGDIPLPTSGQAARSPLANKMVEDALAVDGATSASDFATRAATRKDYASGVASRVTKSLNTTIKHAGQLDSDVDKLHNYTYFPSISNFVHDKYSSNLDPEYQKAKSKFEEDKEAFVKELDFTLSGGHSSVSGSAELRDKISRADSPEAMHAAIQSALHLLSARLDSHTRGFNEGTKSQRDGQDFLYPENRAIYNKLLGASDTSTGQPVPGISDVPPSATPAASAAPKGPLPPGAYNWSPNGLTPAGGTQ